jgi:hypothetical protein
MSKLDFNPELLFSDGPRLPAVKSWLLDTVWTRSRYEASGPDQYLRAGEQVVCALEELIATGAQQVWDELAADSQSSPAIRSWLGLDVPLPLVQPRAAVVFAKCRCC